MSDLLSKLRMNVAGREPHWTVMEEAANEIERLRGIVENIHKNTEDYGSLNFTQSVFKLRVIHDLTKGET